MSPDDKEPSNDQGSPDPDPPERPEPYEVTPVSKDAGSEDRPEPYETRDVEEGQREGD